MEKVQVEEKKSGDPQKIIIEETSQQSRISSEQLQESLKTINEEALQLSEFILQETKLIRELCLLLKQVLKQLNMSFGLPATIFPSEARTQRVILNQEAHLILINDKNEVTSKPLEDCPPQVIFNIVSSIVPEMGRSLASYRKKVSSRVSLFDRMNQELRNLRNILVGESKPEDGSRHADDAVRKALLTQPEGRSEGSPERGS